MTRPKSLRARKLQYAIDAAGLRHADVAARASISPQQLSTVINQTPDPGIRLALRIARAAEVSAEWLWSDEIPLDANRTAPRLSANLERDQTEAPLQQIPIRLRETASMLHRLADATAVEQDHDDQSLTSELRRVLLRALLPPDPEAESANHAER